MNILVGFLISVLFPWPTKTSPTKEVPPTEEAVSKVTQEEEGPAPEVNGHAEEGEEKEAVKSEQVKEKETESNSTASADTEVLVTCSVISLHTPSVHTLEEDKVDRGSPISLLMDAHSGSQHTNKTWYELLNDKDRKRGYKTKRTTLLNRNLN